MGDGALVEFASVVDAVECAVAIQNGVAEREAAVPESQRIVFRIGINVGDIIVEDGDILGDGVNVAARLEGLAEPGGIRLAHNVWNQVKAKLDLAFEPMGEHRVKNIAEPITVFRVNLGRVGSRVPPPIRLDAAPLAGGCGGRPASGVGRRWCMVWHVEDGLCAGCDRGARLCGRGRAGGPALPLPDKPSIAVLPFENLSGDPKQERLAGGLTEDVITNLSRFRELFVIARNSTEVTRASRSMSARSGASWGFVTFSRAAFRRKMTASASPHN